jgi:hypothetical protein
MEALMRQEVDKIVIDRGTKTGIYDGIVYMMYTLDQNGAKPS